MPTCGVRLPHARPSAVASCPWMFGSWKGPITLGFISATAGPASGLQPGDVIEQLDGVSIDDLVTQWRPIYADSNEAARMRDIGDYMTRGACGPAAVSVLRGVNRLSLMSNRVATG